MEIPAHQQTMITIIRIKATFHFSDFYSRYATKKMKINLKVFCLLVALGADSDYHCSSSIDELQEDFALLNVLLWVMDG